MEKDTSIKILFSLFIFFLLIPMVKADVGVGLRWTAEELFLNDFEEKCIVYSVYNPFDTEVTAFISVERDIAPYLKYIEPAYAYLPAYTGAPNDNAAKLANKQDITVCFYSTPVRWPPFYPEDLSGVVLANAMVGKVESTGSSVASVVQAPLTLRLGKIQTFYTFFAAIISISIAVIFVAILFIRRRKQMERSRHPDIREIHGIARKVIK